MAARHTMLISQTTFWIHSSGGGGGADCRTAICLPYFKALSLKLPQHVILACDLKEPVLVATMIHLQLRSDLGTFLFSDNASIVPCESQFEDIKLQKCFLSKYFLLLTPTTIIPPDVWKFDLVHSWSRAQLARGCSQCWSLLRCQGITQVEERLSVVGHPLTAQTMLCLHCASRSSPSQLLLHQVCRMDSFTKDSKPEVSRTLQPSLSEVYLASSLTILFEGMIQVPASKTQVLWPPSSVQNLFVLK